MPETRRRTEPLRARPVVSSAPAVAVPAPPAAFTPDVDPAIARLYFLAGAGSAVYRSMFWGVVWVVIAGLITFSTYIAAGQSGLGQQLRLLVGSDGVGGLESAAGLLDLRPIHQGFPCLSGTVDEHVSRR